MSAPAMPLPERPLPERPMFERPLFERKEFRRVAGETLRPGGLELTRRALALAALPEGSLVLDLGCGPGATSRLLADAGHRVLALDASAAFAGEAAARGLTALRARAERLPLASGCLDAVFCECVLSATGRMAEVLGEAARCLRPGGILALSDLCRRDAAHPAAGDCLLGAQPLEALLAALQEAGFGVLLLEDHSPRLAELAGRLVFAGMSASELCSGCGTNARTTARPGYFLCLARTTES